MMADRDDSSLKHFRSRASQPRQRSAGLGSSISDDADRTLKHFKSRAGRPRLQYGGGGSGSPFGQSGGGNARGPSTRGPGGRGPIVRGPSVRGPGGRGSASESGVPTPAPVNIKISFDSPFGSTADEIDDVRFKNVGTSPKVSTFENMCSRRSHAACMSEGFEYRNLW